MREEKTFNLQAIFMTLGFLLLIFAFVGPFYLDNKLAEYLGVAATPFVSAAAFLLLVSANIMQQKELTLQRAELKETREVFMEQSKTMSLQRFENTFFKMISLQNEIINSTTIHFSQSNATGRQAYLILYNFFRNAYNMPAARIWDKVQEADTEKEKVNIRYQQYFYENENNLAHYFKNLFGILNLINVSNMTFEEKIEYIGILRSQLSNPELQLLFYHSISETGKEFKELILKYNLFDNQLGPEYLIDGCHFDYLTE